MQYKVTQQLTKKRKDYLVQMETGILSTENATKISEMPVVMGTIKTDKNYLDSGSQNTAVQLIWQQQVTIGNQVVLHHVRDDGQGRLSFLRAAKNLTEKPISVPTTPRLDRQPVETEEPEINVSMRTAIGAGVAVNLLALSIGGYLMYNNSPTPQLEAQANHQIQSTTHLTKTHKPLQTVVYQTPLQPQEIGLSASTQTGLNLAEIPQEVALNVVLKSF